MLDPVPSCTENKFSPARLCDHEKKNQSVINLSNQLIINKLVKRSKKTGEGHPGQFAWRKTR